MFNDLYLQDQPHINRLGAASRTKLRWGREHSPTSYSRKMCIITLYFIWNSVPLLIYIFLTTFAFMFCSTSLSKRDIPQVPTCCWTNAHLLVIIMKRTDAVDLFPSPFSSCSSKRLYVISLHHTFLFAPTRATYSPTATRHCWGNIAQIPKEVVAFLTATVHLHVSPALAITKRLCDKYLQA